MGSLESTNEVLAPRMLVEPSDVLALVRGRETSEKRISIERSGCEAGFEQVVYVELNGFGLTLDRVAPRPTAVCSVKVLDVAAVVASSRSTSRRGADLPLFSVPPAMSVR